MFPHERSRHFHMRVYFTMCESPDTHTDKLIDCGELRCDQRRSTPLVRGRTISYVRSARANQFTSWKRSLFNIVLMGRRARLATQTHCTRTLGFATYTCTILFTLHVCLHVFALLATTYRTRRCCAVAISLALPRSVDIPCCVFRFAHIIAHGHAQMSARRVRLFCADKFQ